MSSTCSGSLPSLVTASSNWRSVRVSVYVCPGSGVYMIGAAKTTMNEPENSSTPIIRAQPPTLSLYVTSLIIDFAHTDYELSASMFAAVKCQDDRIGERGARAEWTWEYWQNNWSFRQGSEVWGELSIHFRSILKPIADMFRFQSALFLLCLFCLRTRGFGRQILSSYACRCTLQSGLSTRSNLQPTMFLATS